MPNVFPHPYQLNESIKNFRVVGWYFSFLFNFKKKFLYANSGKPDQTPHVHCLPMSHKKDARLIWIKHLKLHVLICSFVQVSNFVVSRGWGTCTFICLECELVEANQNIFLQTYTFYEKWDPPLPTTVAKKNKHEEPDYLWRTLIFCQHLSP